MEEHEHIWLVVVEVKAIDWETFMRYRGENLDKDLAVTISRPSHTIMCQDCYEIKKVN